MAVVGLGAAGSAAVLALARRGVRVLGLDRFHPPHVFGSTHGRSRVIREAYYESPVYVPLVRRAYELWQRLERDSGRSLLRQTGGLMVGPPDGELILGSRKSATDHGLPHELLDGAAIRRRFPVLEARNEEVGVYEPRAGFLDPEACVESALALAAKAGAQLKFDTLVERWERRGDGLVLASSAGPIECGTAILAAGPWAAGMLGSALPLSVERQVMYWYRTAREPERFAADRLPVFIWEWQAGRMFYGIPDHGSGIKVARHHEGETASPDRVDRGVRPGEIREMLEILRRTIPALDGAPVDAVTCLYTNTPDHHFVLGPLPGEPRLIVASPCSGHGFKFASAIGEVLADLAETGTTSFDLRPFRPDRFASPPVGLSSSAREGERG